MPNDAELVAEYLAKGGKITKCPDGSQVRGPSRWPEAKFHSRGFRGVEQFHDENLPVPQDRLYDAKSHDEGRRALV